MHWLEAVIPTIIALVGGAIGWFLKDKIEAARARDERLHEQRAKLYAQILEPLLAPFSDPEGKQGLRKLQRMVTPSYRHNAFQLVLSGGDAVVKSWNDFMQYMYHAESVGGVEWKIGIEKLGRVLIEVRSNLGNKDTRLVETERISTI